MRTYSVAIANDYTALDSPLIINAGYYNVKLSGYNCITQLDPSEYKIIPYTAGVININDVTIMVKNPGSYTVFLNDPSQSDNAPVPLNFYAWQNVYEMNINTLNFILAQELPSLYKNTNILNAADNAGTTLVILETYATLYNLFYNSITSIGASIGTGTNAQRGYNENWEFVYLGINKILQNAVYPAQFLKTLMRVKSQTSTQRFSLCIIISRLLFQLINVAVPVEIAYDSGAGRYNINIYNEIIDTWSLGTVDFGELDDHTYLLGEGNSFIFLIGLIITRLMPAFVKWRINYFSIATFNSTFAVSDVDNNDYYNPAVLYDAYQVVNNNNNFNTKGFLYV